MQIKRYFMNISLSRDGDERCYAVNVVTKTNVTYGKSNIHFNLTH